MSIFEIPLKQHTPIIHFQSDQIGATLRASDIKPRIDKYLGPTQKYQLTISAVMKYGYPKDKGKELYFGDHKLCMYDDIKLTFNTYFNDDLKDRINEVLPKVFILENFGACGNKGYGCFTIENPGQNEFQDTLKREYAGLHYWEVDTDTIKDILFQIKYFYSLFKSGINLQGRDPQNRDEWTYYKSLLMLYFKDLVYDTSHSLRWEKRGIKSHFTLNAGRNKTSKLDQTDRVIPPKEKYRAIKPLFGYSEMQEWQSYGLNIDRRNPANSKPIKILYPDDIKRIPSPLFFKVFVNNHKAIIYFMLKNENNFMNVIYPNKTFEYSINSTIPPFKPKTPESFDYVKFLNYAVDYINTKLSPGTGHLGAARQVDDFITHLTTKKIKVL
jgi:hypothetical protein